MKGTKIESKYHLNFNFSGLKSTKIVNLGAVLLEKVLMNF